MPAESTQFEPTAGEETATDQGGDSDVASESDTKTDETQPVEGGEADSDGGGDDQAAGEDGGEKEGQVSETEGAGVAPDVSEQIATVKKEILEAMKGGGDAGGVGDEKVLETLSIPEFRPEAMAAIQERYGVDGNQANFMRELVNHSLKGIVGHLQNEFSGMRFEKSYESVSKEKGFEDATAHKKVAEEFLKDFAPTHRSNPVLIRKAVIYARGLNAKAQIKAAAGGAERRTKIISQTRPASASSGQSSPAVRLTASQESAASMYPGGRAAYVKALKARSGGSVNFEKRAA